MNTVSWPLSGNPFTTSLLPFAQQPWELWPLCPLFWSWKLRFQDMKDICWGSLLSEERHQPRDRNEESSNLAYNSCVLSLGTRNAANPNSVLLSLASQTAKTMLSALYVSSLEKRSGKGSRNTQSLADTERWNLCEHQTGSASLSATNMWEWMILSNQLKSHRWSHSNAFFSLCLPSHQQQFSVDLLRRSPWHQRNLKLHYCCMGGTLWRVWWGWGSLVYFWFCEKLLSCSA